MRYWSARAAAEDLVSGKVTEWEKAKYLITSSVLGIILGTLPYWIFNSTVTTLAMVGYVLSVFIVTVGLVKLYQINQRIDGRNFIERYVILSLPAIIKVTILYWLFYVFLAAGLTEIVATNSWVWSLLVVVLPPVYYIAFLWVLADGFGVYRIALK